MMERTPAHRILVVEDEANLADGVKFNLEQEGYEVEVLADGRSAVERIASVEDPTFDLVILDLMLPEMSGYEVARRTRASGNYVAIRRTLFAGSKRARMTTLQSPSDWTSCSRAFGFCCADVAGTV